MIGLSEVAKEDDSGKTFALAVFTAVICRGLAAPISTSIFAASNGGILRWPLGRHTVWVYLELLVIVWIVLGRLIIRSGILEKVEDTQNPLRTDAASRTGPRPVEGQTLLAHDGVLIGRPASTSSQRRQSRRSSSTSSQSSRRRLLASM